jgi:putative endonuclease
VARRRHLLAVVEVKSRRAATAAVEAVTARQRRRITRATEMFLVRHPQHAHLPVRFDVMVVLPWRLPRHLRDAWRVP